MRFKGASLYKNTMDDILPPNKFFPDYSSLTGDRRLDRRAQDLFTRLSEQPASNISKLSSNRAEQIGYYRLLENEKFAEASIKSNRKNLLKDGH